MKKQFISIILVEPENPDNIGATARAMKNMGLNELRLVKPPEEWQEKGKKMAVAADHVLETARVYTKLQDAISDRQLVIGSSRRWGARRGIFLPFNESVRKVALESNHIKSAFVFGKESKGLSNEDLSLCDWITTIPSNPEYPSINLAQAVMVVGFSLFTVHADKEALPIIQCESSRENHPKKPFLKVSKEETKEVLDYLREALICLDYREEGPDVIDRILSTFHSLVKRAGLLRSEAKMFKGLTRRIRERYSLRLGKQALMSSSKSNFDDHREEKSRDFSSP